MTTGRRRALSAGAALLTLLLGADASAWCRMTSSRRAPTPEEPCVLPDESLDPPERFLAWERRCTSVAISVERPSADLPQAVVVDALQRSMATWEAVRCDGQPIGLDVAVLEEASTCAAPLYRDDGGNVNALMFIDDWEARGYAPGAFALTTVWHRRSTGEILDVDLEINEARGPYAVCPPDGCVDERGVDLQNVLTHELGHYLGLAHSAETDATMFASAFAGETSKRDLDPDDEAGICAVYPPGSLDPECSFEPRGGLDPGCERGCAVARVGSSREAPGGAAALAALLVSVSLLRRRPRPSL